MLAPTNIQNPGGKRSLSGTTTAAGDMTRVNPPQVTANPRNSTGLELEDKEASLRYHFSSLEISNLGYLELDKVRATGVTGY